jgi:hypothetical protein
LIVNGYGRLMNDFGSAVFGNTESDCSSHNKRDV